MSRRAKAAEQENHERWLVSYADFITLLFAFFVVMFASSQADKGKAQQVSESVKKALEENQVAAAIAGILGGVVDDKGKGNAAMKGPGGVHSKPTAAERNPQVMAELMPTLDALTKSLDKDIAAGKLQIHLERRGLVISLREAAFFQSGDDAIDPGGYASIQKIAVIIKALPNSIRMEGHTDSVPIHNSRFRSNWELSSARSIAMLTRMSENYGLPESRIAVAGYADKIPIESNETEEGRTRNRRVDVVILNQTGYDAEPEKHAKDTKAAEERNSNEHKNAKNAGGQKAATASREVKH